MTDGDLFRIRLRGGDGEKAGEGEKS